VIDFKVKNEKGKTCLGSLLYRGRANFGTNHSPFLWRECCFIVSYCPFFIPNWIVNLE
jgi:hypothetical protein